MTVGMSIGMYIITRAMEKFHCGSARKRERQGERERECEWQRVREKGEQTSEREREGGRNRECVSGRFQKENRK